MSCRSLKLFSLLISGLSIAGCLLNSVSSIKHPMSRGPDPGHAFVVVGVGLDVPWPYATFQLALDEYSLEKQDFTGNCFHYNHIELTRPSTAASVSYFVFEVPASAYVYSWTNANARLPPAPNASGFIAPAGKTVYFGDYVLVGTHSVELRRNLEAARDAGKRLLPRGAVMEPAEAITPPRGHAFLCTP
jgi:hypothetical protein